MPICQKEITTSDNPVEPGKKMVILTCKTHGVLHWEQYDNPAVGGFHRDLDRRMDTIWKSHVYACPQVHDGRPVLDTNRFRSTQECQWQIEPMTRSAPDSNGLPIPVYRLKCMRHGVIASREITPGTLIYQVQNVLLDEWNDHTDLIIRQHEQQLQQSTAALAPLPPALTQNNIGEWNRTREVLYSKSDSCDKLMVERVDPQTSVHYVVLLCKRHGQIAEKQMTAASSWQMQLDMNALWRQHVVNPTSFPEPQPTRNGKPAPTPCDGPGFGRVGKRKFA